MVSPTVLDGKTNVNVSGNATASANSSNFTIQGSAADVENYARNGNDLIVQMKNGQIHTIRNFGAQGWDFNNLVFTDGNTSSLVDLSKAVSAAGDGIAESLVVTQTIGAGLASATLLGILGAAAAGGAAIAAGGGGDDKASSNPTDPTDPSDKTLPKAPTMLSISEDTGLSAIDRVTSDNRLVFTGKAEANSTVKLFILGAPIGTTTADANGDWSFDFTDTLLPDGNYALTATATDATKNTSPVSTIYAFRVDTTIAPPSALSAADSQGATVTDDVTSANQLVFSGTAEAGASVQLTLNAFPIALVWADSDGNWSFDYTGTTLSAGDYTLRAIATDIAGNVSTVATYSFEVTLPQTFAVTITGNGGNDGIITFVFDEDVDQATFTESGITVANGTLDPGSLTRIDARTYTITVTSDLNEPHTNVAVTLAAGSVTALSGAINSEGKNETTLDYLFDSSSLPTGDITGWDTSHVVSTAAAFISNFTFNQDIGDWNTSAVTNMSDMFSSASTFNQDIGNWNVSSVTNMSGMFASASTFNQDIGNWKVGSVTNMSDMFSFAYAFNQDIGSWDISSLTSASGMFYDGTMSVENMDKTIRGWAKLDTAAGETAIQNNVTWDITVYTDITAVQYLRDHYNWTITGLLHNDVSIGYHTDDTINMLFAIGAQIIHGLGGNDQLLGSAFDDWIVGGAGDDILTGRGGRDTFHYGFTDAGNDTITDFTAGADSDIIHLSDLLVGYKPDTSILSEFITAADNGGGGTLLTIDHDGVGGDTTLVTINLSSVAYNATLLDDMIANGNLVLFVV